MRGCSLMLVSGEGIDTPGGEQQLVDWFARKQPHVCRSTFAAELHSVLDGVNQAFIVQSLLTEMRVGCKTAAQLAALQDAGRLEPKLHVCVDAKSVWDAVRADTVAVPADKHLFLHVLKMREFIDDGIVDKWWWVDTLDMVSDGLTKGSLPREALLDITSGKPWVLRGDPPLGLAPARPAQT